MIARLARHLTPGLRRYLTAAAVALAAVAAVWWTVAAYRTGYDAAMTKVAREQAAARAALSVAETRRLSIQSERDRLARELEEAAREAPVSCPVCLGSDRVRRLNANR